MIALKYTLIIIFITLITLYTLRFYNRLKYNVEFENKLDASASLLISVLIILFVIISINKNISHLIGCCSKYSLIPFFMFMHICLCLFLAYLISLIKVFIKPTHLLSQLVILLEVFISHLKFLYKPFQVKKYLNPFYKIPCTKRNISTIYNIKSTIFICYLISGIIIISPLYNYLIGLSEMEEYLPIIKNDYEIYKSIFITSLIPYFINFFINNNRKYLVTDTNEASRKEEN